MLLTPSKSDFPRRERVLALETAEPTFAPEQDYLSRSYPEWKRIPVEFNFQLHQLQYLSQQFRSCDKHCKCRPAGLRAWSTRCL